MGASGRHAVVLLVAVAACLAYVSHARPGGVGAGAGLALGRFEGSPGAVGVPAAAREQGLRFAPGVPFEHQVGVTAAIRGANPTAQRLIDQVDGLVEVELHVDQDALGITRGRGHDVTVTLDPAAIALGPPGTYELVVLHEFGHVIDHVLLDARLERELDAGIPRSGPCPDPDEVRGPCAATEERFADTFAKWALSRPEGVAGVGYDVEVPPVLGAWALPLERLAAGGA